jgi:hypothetical protein
MLASEGGAFQLERGDRKERHLDLRLVHSPLWSTIRPSGRLLGGNWQVVRDVGPLVQAGLSGVSTSIRLNTALGNHSIESYKE